MESGDLLTIVEVDAEKVFEQGDALIEHRPREVRRFSGGRAIGRVREQRREHVEEVAAASASLRQQRIEHALRMRDETVIVA